MKRIFPLIVISLVLVCSCGEVYRYTDATFYTMSTVVNVISDGDGDFSDIKDFASDFENRVSRTKQNSEIYTLNLGGTAVLSEDTLYILEKSLEIAENTDYAFNPCMGSITELWDITSGKNYVPEYGLVADALEACDINNIRISENTAEVSDGTKVDLGGIAKGYALEKMLEFEISENKDTNVCINLGGNIALSGSSESNRKKDEYGWNVGITNPFDKNTIVGTLKTSDCFIAISGAYERFFEKDGTVYHHIFDPSTGYPAKSDLASTAVINKSGIEGDALSTALFVMGFDKSVEFYKSGVYDFDMILITNDGVIYITEGIASDFTLDADARDLNGKEMSIIKIEK